MTFVKDFLLIFAFTLLGLIGATLYQWHGQLETMQAHCEQTGDCQVVYDPQW